MSNILYNCENCQQTKKGWIKTKYKRIKDKSQCGPVYLICLDCYKFANLNENNIKINFNKKQVK